MATTHITPDQDAVVTEVFIVAPPERVFQAIVDREQALQWGTNPTFQVIEWELDPRPGGKWTSVSAEQGSSRKYEHHGEVVEISPPRLLAYTRIHMVRQLARAAFASDHRTLGTCALVRGNQTQSYTQQSRPVARRMQSVQPELARFGREHQSVYREMSVLRKRNLLS
jgi:uncharacterized protein YndB with AHSA1/START domain